VFGFLDDLKDKVDAMMKLAVAGAIASAAAVVAFFCFAISLFLWVQQTYGTLDAWLALGGLFLVLAIICGIVMISLRRPRKKEKRPDPKPREQPISVSRLLQEPAVLLTGLQLVRMLGPRVIVPALILSAVASGFLMSRNGNGHRDTHGAADAYEQDQGFDAG
jgi:formate hydrogenlyase subunit 3/multisubunit Na+/H+ antiporter MnhD subunit